eukprot:3933811-Rhodomonas_salina.6
MAPEGSQQITRGNETSICARYSAGQYRTSSVGQYRTRHSSGVGRSVCSYLGTRQCVVQVLGRVLVVASPMSALDIALQARSTVGSIA